MLEGIYRSSLPAHVALAYDAWAPVDGVGSVPDQERADWFKRLSELTVHSDYAHSFERWKKSFACEGDRLLELTLSSRLLVGHGNSSAVDVGMTVHHTWGVPVIPGSTLKGLLAHYVDATYGPSDPGLTPSEQVDAERARVDYQGVTWRGGRAVLGPGRFYRALFGAPDTSGASAPGPRDDLHGGAQGGLVTFHDALYVPDKEPRQAKPFAADVLTVHQRVYYNKLGQGAAPNDYDDPNPVSFLTVRPGTRMLIAISGQADWTELAERLLRDALEHWGVGGKTSSGYGRLTAGVRAPTVPVKVGDTVEVLLLEERTKKGGWRAKHQEAGLEGPIQNNPAVPPDAKPGDRVMVEVKISKGSQSGFHYLRGVNPEESPEK
ncbi:MAG: type III-B CRISPR module RAMP protein Cmr6 [Trueperaceae bacterium]|nr:type III-B CRISPR module RAMP protein Cmr6 [Trueperaceae bacterium]